MAKKKDEVTEKWTPVIGEKHLFNAGRDDEFVGTVEAIDPYLVVTKHEVIDGVVVDSVAEPTTTIAPIDPDEAFRRLAN